MEKLLSPKQFVNSVEFEQGPDLLISPAAQLEVEGFTVVADNSGQAVNSLIEAGMTRLDAHTVQIGSLKIEISD